MDLEAELLREHSKAHAESIARWAGEDRRRLDKLMRILLKGEFLPAQRAAWVVSTLAEQQPLLFRPYLRQMLVRFQESGIHDAVRRAIARVLQDVEIPEGLLGMAANICFEQLSSATAPIAVKVYSMTVLARISEKEPDLGRELRLVIEQQLPYASAAFRARAREIFKQL